MKHGIWKFVLLAGILLSSVTVSALALVAASTTASANGGIVIHGLEESSSQLKLTVSGEDLVVDGPLESGEQAGCEFTDGHNALRCPLAGVSGIEVVTGRSNDTVEVIQPLPVGLTVRLGDGSDEFTGSDEFDTCYMGPGQDICHGGQGNDRLYGESGPDKLYGEVGDDQVYGGSASDRLYGENGNDRLYGESGPDKLKGGYNPDKLYGGSGSDDLYGEVGKDFCKGAPGVGHSYTCETGPGD